MSILSITPPKYSFHSIRQEYNKVHQVHNDFIKHTHKLQYLFNMSLNKLTILN